MNTLRILPFLGDSLICEEPCWQVPSSAPMMSSTACSGVISGTDAFVAFGAMPNARLIPGRICYECRF